MKKNPFRFIITVTGLTKKEATLIKKELEERHGCFCEVGEFASKK